MGRIERSWQLGKTSWRVLRTDKDLAAFPVFSAIASLVVLAVFAGLVFAMGLDTQSGKESMKPIGWVLVAVLYVAMSFIAVFFQAALTYGANERLEGRDTSIRASIDAANAKIHRLLPWALFTATVSLAIRAIEERAGLFGRIIVSLLGAAWSLVTFLTIPIIMLEDLGPWNALKRSGNLFKGTWGENVAAQFGFGLIGMIAALPAIILIAAVASADVIVLTVAVAIVGVAWIAIVSVVVSAMTGIYKVALYRYAVDGKAPAAFEGSDLGGAFVARKSIRRSVGGGFGGFGGGGFSGGGNGGGFAGPPPSS